MSDLRPYTDRELQTLFKDLDGVRDQPLMLHAAYALCSLSELALGEPEEDEDAPEIDSMWGTTIPTKIIDRLTTDVANDFNDAAQNHKPIKIWGKAYSIRKANTYDKELLPQIFRFQELDGKYILSKDGIINLQSTIVDKEAQYESVREEAKENRLYLRQVIKMAEDDANDGWDQLTDMEIILYCWAMYFNKTQSCNYLDFKNQYKDYLCVGDAEVHGCYSSKVTNPNRPNSICPFSAKKVQQWNKNHRQISKVENIPPQEAEDYWYEIALKTTFTPAV